MRQRAAEQAKVIRCLLFGWSLNLAFPYPPSLVQAASPITSSGLNTQVSAPLPLAGGQTQFNITGGSRPGGGVNLFHSFGNFNVPTHNIANFLNSGSIDRNGTVQLTDSKISASVLDGTGGGGSMTLDPQFVLLQKSQILANAVFGPGGNIFITTNLLQPDTTSIISASSQFGQNGTITVQSPIAPASRIIVLSQKPLIATPMVTQRCAAVAGGNLSSFTVAGRESLPAEPSSWLSSPLALATAESGGDTGSEPETPTSLSEPTEEVPILSLRRIAPPGFLTQSFAVDESGSSSSPVTWQRGVDWWGIVRDVVG